MSRDANSFGMPPDVAAAPIPETMTEGAQTLREQAQEIIDEVLSNTAPENARVRDRLRRCVFRHPGHPELALLEQLMNKDESYTSRKKLA